MEPSKYPECDKLAAVSEDSNKIGAFLDWLSEQGIRLAKYTEDDELLEERSKIEELLARYYGIDLKKVEDERQSILRDCHDINATR